MGLKGRIARFFI